MLSVTHYAHNYASIISWFLHLIRPFLCLFDAPPASFEMFSNKIIVKLSSSLLSFLHSATYKALAMVADHGLGDPLIAIIHTKQLASGLFQTLCRGAITNKIARTSIRIAY